MKIENQVNTIQQGKRLVELGIAPNSLFSYFGSENMRLKDNATSMDYGSWIFIQNTVAVNNQQLDARSNVSCEIPIAPAFTVAELGEMLPDDRNHEKWQYRPFLEFYSHTDKDMWKFNDHYTRYGSNKIVVTADNEAQARAEMLIWLLENKHITPKEVTTRLNAN